MTAYHSLSIPINLRQNVDTESLDELQEMYERLQLDIHSDFVVIRHVQVNPNGKPLVSPAFYLNRESVTEVSKTLDACAAYIDAHHRKDANDEPKRRASWPNVLRLGRSK